MTCCARCGKDSERFALVEHAPDGPHRHSFCSSRCFFDWMQVASQEVREAVPASDWRMAVEAIKDEA